MMKLHYTAEADVFQHIYLKEDNDVAQVGEFHDSMEFIFLLEGKLEACLDDKKVELKEGCIFFADSYEIHRYKRLTEKIKVLVVVLSREYADNFKKTYLGLSLPTYMLDTDKNQKIFDLVKNWLTEDKKSFLKNTGYVCLMFSYFIDNYPLVKKRDENNDISVVDMLRYINQNYTKPLTLEMVAKECGYSVGYCSKVLKKAVGYSFNDYVNLLRLSKVEEFLSDKTLNMTKSQAFYESGFNSPVTYYRVKKKFS